MSTAEWRQTYSPETGPASAIGQAQAESTGGAWSLARPRGHALLPLPLLGFLCREHLHFHSWCIEGALGRSLTPNIPLSSLLPLAQLIHITVSTLLTVASSSLDPSPVSRDMWAWSLPGRCPLPSLDGAQADYGGLGGLSCLVLGLALPLQVG